MTKKIETYKPRLVFRHLYNKASLQGYYSYGFLLDSLPQNLIDELDTKLKEILEDKSDKKQLKYNTYLAGEIEEEYFVKFSRNFSKYVSDLCKYYEVSSKGFIKKYISSIPINSISLKSQLLSKKLDNEKVKSYLKSYEIPELLIEGGWVNLQKKYEYNPIHSHDGLLSFVVWHKTPFLHEDEDMVSGSKNKTERQSKNNGSFNFIYPIADQIEKINMRVDKRWDGVIAIFPSDLEHSVNPFYTSDDYRVSFSGNIYLKDEKSIIEFRKKIL